MYRDYVDAHCCTVVLKMFLYCIVLSSGCVNVDSEGRRYLLLLALSCMTAAACLATWMVHMGHLGSLPHEAHIIHDQPPSTSSPVTAPSFTTYLTRYFYSGAVLCFCFFSFLGPGEWGTLCGTPSPLYMRDYDVFFLSVPPCYVK